MKASSDTVNESLSIITGGGRDIVIRTGLVNIFIIAQFAHEQMTMALLLETL